MRPMHIFEDNFSEEIHERYPELRKVLGRNAYPFGVGGADMEAMPLMVATGRDRFE